MQHELAALFLIEMLQTTIARIMKKYQEQLISALDIVESR